MHHFLRGSHIADLLFELLLHLAHLVLHILHLLSLLVASLFQELGFRFDLGELGSCGLSSLIHLLGFAHLSFSLGLVWVVAIASIVLGLLLLVIVLVATLVIELWMVVLLLRIVHVSLLLLLLPLIQ